MPEDMLRRIGGRKSKQRARRLNKASDRSPSRQREAFRRPRGSRRDLASEAIRSGRCNNRASRTSCLGPCSLLSWTAKWLHSYLGRHHSTEVTTLKPSQCARPSASSNSAEDMTHERFPSEFRHRATIGLCSTLGRGSYNLLSRTARWLRSHPGRQ